MFIISNIPTGRSSKHQPPAQRSAAQKTATQGASERRLVELCSMSVRDTLKELDTKAKEGLTTEEAEKRLDEYGANELAHAKRLGVVADLLERCKSPLVIQLLVIAIISGIVGETKSASIVGAMIILSVGLSFILDRRSGQAVEALGKRVQSRTLVLRDGEETEIRISDVVPGDIVLLMAGSIIPADVRLLSAKDFFVSQSALTGESMPVEKSALVDKEHEAGLSAWELPNACYLGSSVNSGSARAVVVNTGVRTLFGSISASLAEKPEETSFDKGTRSFTWLMIRFMLVMTAAVFMIVGMTKGNWVDALLFGLSIAVGLTPEMLPMIVTVNLAKGALTMAAKKVIIKRLPSIQNFGAIDILCTDKTGTLTQDKVVLEKYVDLTGRTSEDVLTYAYLNSHYQTGLRNLIDRAILDHTDMNVQLCRLVDELPFDFQRRRMSVVVDFEGDHVLICKGAVEEIYECCSHYQIGEEVYPLFDMIRDNLFEEVERHNRDGFRVLAIAYREFPREKTQFEVKDESQMILLGFIAFFDPPKAQASEALGLLQEAGVRVKVLTGDNGLVTQRVCTNVGLKADRMLTGAELSRVSAEDFAAVVQEVDIFVKLSPAQKEQIVRSLRASGHVVGFLGDGINDAPALKAADVGISVDSGVDVAKETADIVLLEKSLLVLEEGIMEGRRVFANIVKYIRMGASSNFGNMFSVMGASYLLPFLPMQPVQILTNNLLYDFSQTGIPTDRVDPELVAKPLKWNIENIKRFMFCVGPISSLFDYATFALMWYVFGCAAYNAPGVTALQQEGLAKLFQTGWFVESLLTQTLIVHIIRTRRIPFFGSCASLPMTLTTLGIMGIGAWLPYSPFAAALNLVPLPPVYWVWIIGFLLTYSILTHFVKTWFFNRFGGD
ncbi:magnesium-translocating P-type ATPase [Geomonas oryzisoli]|uniref:Magnesium-transporting ATPase, P-type 1 n=1 Tax=Geomonas oryzisoli TaxID=2847992 RepID=A0ABX8J9T4_9BACT|nr:magnesium-translocating P-type ATPase [Geomonas oryzisoli]QWV93862.1 magnesium-translocating P-type ATPase [Geomonas oryzisoli]